MKFILLGVCLFACNTPSITRDKVQITIHSDDRLSHYVSEFLLDCRKYLSETICSPPIDLQITVSELDKETLGLCSIWPYTGRRLIEIDPAIIGQYNERIVMYHELFHCVLNIPHNDESVDIMNTYEIDENTKKLYENWSEYVRIVFLRKK